MSHICKFNDYKINEALGIPESTLFYIEIIKSRILIEIMDYVDRRPNLDNPEQIEVVIPYSNIRRFITDWTFYPEFPVTEIIVDLKMIKRRPNEVKTQDLDTKQQIQTPFKIGGYASAFARGRERAATRLKDPIKLNTDHSISIHIGIDFEYSANYRKERHEKKLSIKIESVILHEINHVYENYKRKIKGKKDIEYTTTWASIGQNRMRRPKILWNYWQSNFTDYIYQSEPHEVRAYVQEAKAYVDKLDFDSFKNTNLWKTAKIMQNFDYKEFIESFNKEIYKYNPEYVDKIIDVLVKDFCREYRRLSIEFKEENQIKPGMLDKLNTQDFFNFWQRKIREAGTTIVKKMIRLYSYKKSKEGDIY